MKPRLLLPAIIATATALGASASAHSEPRDAQAQAAALLSRPHAPGLLKGHEGAPSSAAALDAHASAAALLSGRTIHVGERGSEHPAVLVARNWGARGIDPNTFIVAHPARLQLVAAPPIYIEPETAERLSRTSN